MKVLTINSGSSSLKFKLFEMPSEEVLIVGQFKHYDNKSHTFTTHIESQEDITTEVNDKVWDSKVEYLFNYFLNNKVINSISDINLITHRIVHGGEKYTEPTLLNVDVIEDLEENYNEFAPLHNPVQTEIIMEFMKLCPDIPQVGVFDTAFNSTMESVNFLYGLPYEYYEQYRIRRYGFHGISYKYIHSEVKRLYNRNNIKIVSCHLGSGSSIAAIKNGKVVDNSMGFKPQENLVMSTRVGDTDFDSLLYLKEKENLKDQELEYILNNKSGLLGISGYTPDMKQLLKDESINERAKLAIDIYIHNITKYIASYISELNGIDVLTFSGGIGEGSDEIRAKIISQLKVFNLKVDVKVNNGAIDVNRNLKISSKESICDIWVIPTNEELQMARESSKLL